MKKFEIKFGVVKNHEWVVNPEVEILHHEEQALTRYCELKRNAERGNPMLQEQFGKDYKTIVVCDVYADENANKADLSLTQEFFNKTYDILAKPALESGTKSLPIETLTD
jgi:hypothetical protein